jgi:hypothetical protein
MSRCEDIVYNKEGKLLTDQTTVIVDITFRKTTLVRAAEHVRSGSLHARRGVECGAGVEWRLYEWAYNLLTSCLPFTLRSATVGESGYISENVFSVASAVTCESGELKSAGNVLTGGQRVC